jgi:hypothetical protein
MDVVVSHDSVIVAEPDNENSLAVRSDLVEQVVRSALVGVSLDCSNAAEPR